MTGFFPRFSLACAAMLVLVLCRAESVAPFAVQQSRESARLDLREVIDTGAGAAVLTVQRGDLLAVACVSAAAEAQTQADRQFTLRVYSMVDTEATLLAILPLKGAARLMQITEAGQLLVADDTYLTRYLVSVRARSVRPEWTYPVPDLQQVLALPTGYLLRTDERLITLGMDGSLLDVAFLGSGWLCESGVNKRYLIGQPGGSCDLYVHDQADRLRFIRRLPILGDVARVFLLTPSQVLVQDREGLLRIYNSRPLMPTNFSSRPPPEELTDKIASRFVRAEYQLALKVKQMEMGARELAVLDHDGLVWLLPVDVNAIGEPRQVAGLAAISSISYVGRNGTAVSAEGEVFVFGPEAVATRVLSPVQTGPLFVLNEQVYVCMGTDIRQMTDDGLGPVATKGETTILDVQVDGDHAYALMANALLVLRSTADGNLERLAALPLASGSRRLRVGDGRAAVVHGHNRVSLIDLRTPDAPAELATRSLEIEPDTAMSVERWIRDVALDSGRLLVASSGVDVYDCETFADNAAPLFTWKRPFVSLDEFCYPELIHPIGTGAYLIASRGGAETRAYILTTTADGLAWRYTQLGLGNAMDVQVTPDGLLLAACGDMGVRALRVQSDTRVTYLGSDREPDRRYQQLVRHGERVYVRSGNQVLAYDLSPQSETHRLAFRFEPQGDQVPRIHLEGLDVTSEAYRARMGYRNPLKVQKMDLSDAAGFPHIAVPQGTVGVDPGIGRILFADGNADEPRFLSRSEHMNVGLVGWRRAGDYAIAALSEQAMGFAVMDIRDPKQLHILSVAGQAPYHAYPHTVVAYRDGYAYITGNLLDILQPVDMRDPLKPHYEAPIPRDSGDVMKWASATRYTGFFRGDRLFVPCSEGMLEVDVSNPERIRRVALHAAARGIHQVFPEQNRAVRLLNGRLEFLDITDIAKPQVLGRYPASGKFASEWGVIVTEGDRTYIRSPDASGAGWLLTMLDTRDWSAPTLLGTFEVPDDGDGAPSRYAGNTFEVRDGLLYLPGDFSLFVLDWRDPANPTLISQLGEAAFLGTWSYRFMEQTPRKTTVVQQRYGRRLHVEMMDGDTLWLYSHAGVYAVDITDPQTPKVVGSGPGFGESYWVRADDSDLAMIGDYRHAFIDISDPLNPRCLIEFSGGHPYESGYPVPGTGMPRLETSDDEIRRWQQDPQTGEITVQATPLMPLWLAHDLVVNGRSYCHIIAGQGGRGSTALLSDAMSVTAGESLQIGGLLRTSAYAGRARSGDRDRYSNETMPSEIWLRLTAPGSDRPVWQQRFTHGDGVMYRLNQRVTIPQGVDSVQLSVTVAGDIALGELALNRDGKNLLTNGDLSLGEADSLAGWTFTAVSGGKTTHMGFAADYSDGDVLYMINGHELFLYDLHSDRRFPVARIAAQLHAESDLPVLTKVRRQGNRKIAYVATYQGLVSIDVTDPYRPARLGAISLPTTSSAQHGADFYQDTLIYTTGYTSDKTTHGFFVIDISDPATMRLRSAVQGTRHSGTVVHNGYAILGDYGQGMQIWDIRDPDRPALIVDQGFVRTSQCRTIEFHGSHVLRNEVGGLEIWEAPLLPQTPRGRLEVQFHD